MTTKITIEVSPEEIMKLVVELTPAERSQLIGLLLTFEREATERGLDAEFPGTLDEISDKAAARVLKQVARSRKAYAASRVRRGTAEDLMAELDA